MQRKKILAKKQVNIRLDLETRRALKRLARDGKLTQTELLTQLIWQRQVNEVSA